MNVPQYIPVVYPSDVKPGTNGQLGPNSLKPTYFPGYGWSSLHPNAKRCWDAMVVAHQAANVDKGILTVTPGGAYRNKNIQVSGFSQRMLPVFDPNTCAVPEITRDWNSHTYYLRRGMMPVAAPEWYDTAAKKWKGGSNHGCGIALDTAWYDKATGTMKYITTNKPGWEWILANYVSFGFSHEGAKPGQPGYEAHHIRMVTGDKIPQRVLDIEAYFGGIKG